jgi:hypothetical protein
VEAVRSGRFSLFLPVLAGVFVCGMPMLAQRPYDNYLAATKRGIIENRVQSFVSGCIGGTAPRPQGFYSQAGWFASDNLPAQVRDNGADDDATAWVWMAGTKPRAVYQWTHDSEFDRDVLACVDGEGRVTRAVSRYMPGTSEPKQHWIFIHALDLNQRTGQFTSHGRFTDWQGTPMGTPHMSTEDKDFLAGERVLRKWSDFDFAHLVQ